VSNIPNALLWVPHSELGGNKQVVDWDGDSNNDGNDNNACGCSCRYGDNCVWGCGCDCGKELGKLLYEVSKCAELGDKEL
jgi:hypothetical protein